MNINASTMNKHTGGEGAMKSEDGESLKEIVKLYYGDPTLTEDEKDSVNEMLESVEQTNFLDKCRKVVDRKDKDNLHLGKLHISKVACLVAAFCVFVMISGFVVVIRHIKEIQLVDKGNHSEVKFEYNYNPDTYSPSEIKDYHDPVWIPDGYNVIYESKGIHNYYIMYELNDSNFRISYNQAVPYGAHHFSTENGKSETVSFGEYIGEYVETDKCNYLIVTDGTYLYSLISELEDKETLIKMLD